jgi:glutaredoxin
VRRPEADNLRRELALAATDQLANVTLYSKPDCPLCDEARGALVRVRSRVQFDLDEIDITSAPALEAAYRERIPVVAVEGEEVFDFHVDEPALEQLLSEGALAR